MRVKTYGGDLRRRINLQKIDTNVVTHKLTLRQKRREQNNARTTENIKIEVIAHWQSWQLS